MVLRAGRQTKFIVQHAKKPYYPVNNPKYVADETHESLTGLVRGMKASNLEERWCKGLDLAMERTSSVDDYYFRFVLGAGRGLPGWKELDSLVISRGAYYPVEIDDTTFIHLGSSGHDTLNEVYKMDALQKMGIQAFPIRRVTDKQLGSIEQAYETAREIFG